MAELAGDSGAESLAFHDALACGLAAMARDCATVRGIDTMVCSGGGCITACWRRD